jgi:glycosyltransferase involved in cell wall biosynthesis
MPPTNSKSASPLQASDICVVTPTKGRHKQLTQLLATLARQTQPVGKIIIADGGGDAEALVASFQDRLPVIWLDCPEPGQILQRNFALKQVPSSARVIIYFDDDIQLEPDAVEILVKFWNAQDQEPAGVSFNITNMPKQPDNLFRHVFLTASEPRGRVWKSGYNSPVTGVDSDLRSQWLIGGATAWRRDILFERVNEGIRSRWAITEDLMFSYPISKSGENLFVCAQAKVHHIDDTPTETFSSGLFRGNSAVLWRYLFVIAHPELSRLAMVWMVLGQIAGRVVQGLRGRTWNFGYAIGYTKGLMICARSMLTGRDIRHFLD